MKRVIVELVTQDHSSIKVGAPIAGYNGFFVTEISTRRDGIASVTTGAGDTFVYHITMESTNEEGEKDVIMCCIPFDEIKRIYYKEIIKEKQQEEPVVLEAV